MKFTPALATALLACVAAAAPSSGTCANRDYICRRYAAKHGVTTASCDVGLQGCVEACQAGRRRCAAAPNANTSACAASLQACTGSVNLGDAAAAPGADSSSSPSSPSSEKASGSGGGGGGAAAVMWPRDGPAAGSCKVVDDACRADAGADEAKCSAEQAQCMGHCSKKGDACRAAPGANMADCSAAYAECLGENPYTDAE